MHVTESKPKKKTNFEYMKRLELDILALVTKEVHHHFEICFVRDVSGHDIEVCSVEENLA
jgi:hypothetical protein